MNIVCIVGTPLAASGARPGDGRAGLDGSFTVQVVIPEAFGVCRLRALPTNLPDPSYLGTFSGPIMYIHFRQGEGRDEAVSFAVATAFGPGSPR